MLRFVFGFFVFFVASVSLTADFVLVFDFGFGRN